MLNKIVERKKAEVELQKRQVPLEQLTRALPTGNHALAKAFAADWGLIAECKLASPVKGRLSNLAVEELAKIYNESGAAAISVLTDRHFEGNLSHLQAVKAISKLPVLRKDFIVDEYQLYQAQAAGADAILLITAILSDDQLKRYLAVAGELGLDCLTEVHNREELARAQQTEAKMIGINNRDLTTFRTNIEQTFALLPFCDTERLIISESGISSGADAERLKQAGVRGALVGEGLVTAANIARKVSELSLQPEV